MKKNCAIILLVSLIMNTQTQTPPALLCATATILKIRLHKTVTATKSFFKKDKNSIKTVGAIVGISIFFSGLGGIFGASLFGYDIFKKKNNAAQEAVDIGATTRENRAWSTVSSHDSSNSFQGNSSQGSSSSFTTQSSMDDTTTETLTEGDGEYNTMKIDTSKNQDEINDEYLKNKVFKDPTPLKPSPSPSQQSSQGSLELVIPTPANIPLTQDLTTHLQKSSSSEIIKKIKVEIVGEESNEVTIKVDVPASITDPEKSAVYSDMQAWANTKNLYPHATEHIVRNGRRMWSFDLPLNMRTGQFDNTAASRRSIEQEKDE